MTVYERLAELCKLKGENITSVVKKLGYSTGSPPRWKAGGTINSDILLNLAEYLNVSVDYLLTGKDSISDTMLLKSISESDAELLDLIHKLPAERQIELRGEIKAELRFMGKNKEKEEQA